MDNRPPQPGQNINIELGEIIGPRSHGCDQDLGIGACRKDLLVGTGDS